MQDRESTSRRQFMKLLAGGTVSAVLIAACGAPPSTPEAKPAATQPAAAPAAAPTATPVAQAAPKATLTEVTVWGMSGTPDSKQQKNVIDYISTKNPALKLKAESVPDVAGQTGSSMQKMITAIAGGNVPDFFYFDRFLTVDFAARGALLPIEDYMNQGPHPNLARQEYIEANYDEGNWNGKQWDIASNWGAVGFWSLAWNRDCFKKAGLDPNKPPANWDELLDFAKKLTIRSGSRIDQIGFLPTFGASMLYQWGWANGGQFVSEDGKKTTLSDPKNVEALDFLVKISDAQGSPQELQDFLTGFTAGAGDPFITGKIGMMVMGEYQLSGIGTYNPKLDFGLEVLPPPKTGGTTASWVGGWSWAIPKGSKKPLEATTVIDIIQSPESTLQEYKGAAEDAATAAQGGIFVPSLIAHKKAQTAVKGEFLAKIKEAAPSCGAAYEFYEKAPELYSKMYFRPKSLVAQRLWELQIQARDEAVFKKKTSAQALKDADTLGQTALDEALAKGLSLPSK